LQSVSGGYSHKKPVIHRVSFDVLPGEMVGLIGLNGAGKSTTIKHILGLMDPQEGKIRIHGREMGEDPDTYRSSYAYVPESPLLYEELTVHEHLCLSAMAYGIEPQIFKSKSE